MWPGDLLMKNYQHYYRGIIVLILLISASPPGFAQTAGSAIASRNATVDGIKLHYLTAGHGSAVILLHGYTPTSRMWKPIIPILGEKFTVIGPDLAGIRYAGITAG